MWSFEQMETALNAIRGGKRIREVFRAFGFAGSTLQDTCRNGNTVSGPKMGRNAVFTRENRKLLKRQSIADKAWLKRFLRRNPNISLTKPKDTSINRITAFDSDEVTRHKNF